MEAEQRIQALEQEVQILKTQIQSILLDIQTHLLTNAYPALRGSHTAAAPSSDDDDDDDEYDRATPAPKVRKMGPNSSPVKPTKSMPPLSPAEEPMLASLDEQQEWVLQNIQNVGVTRTRDLIANYTEQRRFSPEVSDTLLRFTNMYAAAADEPTIPSRPAAMTNTMPVVKVNAVNKAPQRPVNNHIPQPTVTPHAPSPVVAHLPPSPARSAPQEPAGLYKAVPKPKAAPLAPPPVQREDPVKHIPAPNAENEKPVDTPNVVLRLIAGVQNAGAGVRWGKTKS